MSFFEPLRLKMTNAKSKRSSASRLQNKQGQVALFVALIFQILFIFFAAVVNVGLVVHQKINLQNSVDLAAYYAGMKQAEMLNSMAHMNYQIRQSWKLLAWRYRILGSAGTGHNINGKIVNPYNNQDGAHYLNTAEAFNGSLSGSPDLVKFSDTPDFCITYPPWGPPRSDQTFCKDMASVGAIKPPAAIPGNAFPTLYNQLVSFTETMMKASKDDCQYRGPFNFYVLSQFAVGYKFDQNVRKEAISFMSRALSHWKDDFLDIDGNSVREGAEKTLKGNLTGPNRASVTMQLFNGLGQDACNDQGVNQYDPAKFLKEIRIIPAFAYRDWHCSVDEKILKMIEPSKELSPTSLPEPVNMSSPRVAPIATQLQELIPWTEAVSKPPYNYSIGYEKNPWCVAYAGIKATATPKVAFLPFDSIKLTAVAYAKPFGGKFGPWFSQTWPSGSDRSTGGQIDGLLPARASDAGLLDLTNASDPKRIPNYSRYPGDNYGLKARSVQGYFTKALYELDPSWPQTPRGPKIDANLYPAPSYGDYQDAWRFPPEQNMTGPGDVMAWNVWKDTPSEMRKLETLAILPDLYDMAYYSIEPDFYNNYFVRLKAGLFNGTHNGLTAPASGLRGDLGMRFGKKDFEDFNILKQITYAKQLVDVLKMDDAINNVLTHFVNPSKAESAYNVLNSFIGKNMVDFSVDTTRFGKCSIVANADAPNPGGCVVGGRTGYSVKLVSDDWLRSPDLNLGNPKDGVNGAGGPLLNPPLELSSW